MENKVVAIARVQVTVEVKASLWGDDCSLGQLYRQAAEDGKNQVRQMIGNAKAIIVDDPKVIAVITEEIKR
jgi:hypothetical protein